MSLAGDARPPRALLDQAQALIERAASAGRRAAVDYFDGELFRLQRGMAELHLGNWGTAAGMLAVGLAALPESTAGTGPGTAHAWSALTPGRPTLSWPRPWRSVGR